MSQEPTQPDATPDVFFTFDKKQAFPYPRSHYIKRMAWNAVRRTLFRFSPNRAVGWRRWLLRCFGARLGFGAGCRPTTVIWHPWLLEMGEHAMLGDRVVVYNLGPIRIGNHSTVSQDAELCAGSHDYRDPTLPLLRPPVTVGHGVWVCAGAFVGPGVTVGDNSIVGARAVVTSDVPAEVIVGGNPAAVLKPRPMTPRAQPAGADEKPDA